MRNVANGTTVLASQGSSGASSVGVSDVGVSDDGRYVVFAAPAGDPRCRGCLPARHPARRDHARGRRRREAGFSADGSTVALRAHRWTGDQKVFAYDVASHQAAVVSIALNGQRDDRRQPVAVGDTGARWRSRARAGPRRCGCATATPTRRRWRAGRRAWTASRRRRRRSSPTSPATASSSCSAPARRTCPTTTRRTRTTSSSATSRRTRPRSCPGPTAPRARRRTTTATSRPCPTTARGCCSRSPRPATCRRRRRQRLRPRHRDRHDDARPRRARQGDAGLEMDGLDIAGGGHYAVFASNGRLVNEDTGTNDDVYRLDLGGPPPAAAAERVDQRGPERRRGRLRRRHPGWVHGHAERRRRTGDRGRLAHRRWRTRVGRLGLSRGERPGLVRAGPDERVHRRRCAG